MEKHRKIIKIGLVVVLLFSMFLIWANIIGPGLADDRPQNYTLHYVFQGDTLWGISKKYMPEVDPRKGVDMIVEINGLDSKVIHRGDLLFVPCEDGELDLPLLPGDFGKKELETIEFEINPVKVEYRGKTYKEVVMEATAYTAGFESTGKNPGDKGYGEMKTGFYVDSGAIAVDPSVIPLGSVLWVEGYGYGIALDTGGKIKGNIIDVYFEEVPDAIKWGRRQVKVRIY